jgi:predicted ATPase
MLVQRLKVSGLLSFGPRGIDLPLDPLNVLIGPNGSGKSNLLEVLALLRAAPRQFAEPIMRRGGIAEWLWKGHESVRVASLETIVTRPNGAPPLKHALTLADNGGRLNVAGEELTGIGARKSETESYYRLRSDLDVVGPRNRDDKASPAERRRVTPEESILSQLRDSLDFPALGWLQEQYERIRLYRNWSFGPTAAFRRDQSAHGPADFLNDRAGNLALVLSHFKGDAK